MATKIYLVKRYKAPKNAKGKRTYTWDLRWKAGGKFHCKSTGQADKTKAAKLAEVKWMDVNFAPAIVAVPTVKKVATWAECREALKREMELHRKRPSYINDALQNLDSLKKMFPQTVGPTSITVGDAQRWLESRARQKVNEDGDTLSAWTIKGDLCTLKAIYSTWLGKNCLLAGTDGPMLTENPFANLTSPACDEPDVRTVALEESAAFLEWIAEQWNGWKLPAVYFGVADRSGWRATELASIKTDDILPDGCVRMPAKTSKTRREKFAHLPPALHADLKACAADGWAFGRFSVELSRLLSLWKKRPHQAAAVKSYAPERLVGWLQDQLQAFHAQATKAAERRGERHQPFTLHDLRRTAISGLLEAGNSIDEVSDIVGASPAVIRKHYKKIDQPAVARRCNERRMQAEAAALAGLTRPLRKDESA